MDNTLSQRNTAATKTLPFPFARGTQGGLKIPFPKTRPHENGGEDVAVIRLLRQPAFYTQKTSNGTLMSRVGTMQGTYLAIYPAQVWILETGKTRSIAGFVQPA